MIYHSKSADDVLSYFEVDKNKGLPTGVADKRLEEYGKNILHNNSKTSIRENISSILKNYVNIFLLISAIISLVINLVYNKANWYSPILILIMLCINTVITILCQKKSEKITDSLKTMNTPSVKVLRDGIVKFIDASYIVPGDILLLETGDYVAADARLISTTDFRCNEATITGEEIAEEKNCTDILDDIAAVNRRTNMVFSGSNVITGHARAVVTETGINTEIGKAVTIFEAYNSTELKIKEKLTSIGKACAVILAVFCTLIFILNIALNINSGDKFASLLVDSFMNSIVLLVSVLPEGLPIMAAVAMGYSIDALLKNGLIIKDFAVFDVLPEVSVICSDKTGTLTQDKMQVEKIFNGREIIDCASATEDTNSVMILRLASLCTCQSKDDIDTPMYNDATELSIIDTYNNCVSEDQRDIFNHYPCLFKIPFDPQRKATLTVNMIDGIAYAIIKGAPDYLLEQCNNSQDEHILKTVNEFASCGMRVIAVAFKQLSEIPSNFDYSDVEGSLSFAGLIALSDPPQSDSVALVSECAKGGIRTVMITGDHAATARAVAVRLGILKDNSEVITGDELQMLSDDELLMNINRYSVFARLLPDQKARIVEAYKKQGMIVAITGDSVNDAVALSNADVGIAMGEKGTDVARGASDIIMNNNHFSSIISAINISRGLFSALRKAITYLFSSNICELLSVFICLLISGKFPILAAPLLLVNLITDVFPVISILSDGIHEHKPMHISSPEDKALFTFKSKLTIAVQTFVMTAAAIIAFTTNLKSGDASSMLFAVLILSQLSNTVSLKFDDFFYKHKHFRDISISVILGALLLLTLLILVTPLASAFGLTVLSFSQLIGAVALSFMAFASGELIKFGFYLFEKSQK